ncbi:hypothetical protein QF035_004598 [Streptomyces umbrinus]|uniref:DUF4238 domain-containing protein n=1 Tax=Streptomyces umbrinus TaxID=67370 RepID=A0ABU0STY8_9ACTN|nr:DUF4238 domain-containing protein [Streptomyces umbrinus]MDQ1027016.1 hypothetical protein [Streptomyces umbrinus]
MSTPKLHHYVPQSYLARFGHGEQVRVRRRLPAKTHLANVKNIAAETGFYTITDENGAPSTVIERELCELEGTGLAALRRIDETDMPPLPGSDDRELLCLYLAVQMARTPRKRTMMLFAGNLTAYADGREVDKKLVAEYLTKKHLGYTPRPAEAEGAWAFCHGLRAESGGDPTQNDAVILPLQSVQVCLPEFRARHWRLEASRKPNFLTSDAPLVVWRPHTASDAFSGFGLKDAEEIRFPVSPSAQLVLIPGQGTSVEEVKLSRVGTCNQDIADSCQHVVVGHPDRHAALDKVELRKRGPVLRFNVGPGVQENSDGTHEPMGDILHMWTTRR